MEKRYRSNNKVIQLASENYINQYVSTSPRQYFNHPQYKFQATINESISQLKSSLFQFVQAEVIEEFYLQILLKYCSNLETYEQLKFLQVQNDLIKQQQCNYNKILQIVISRKNCIKCLKDLVNSGQLNHKNKYVLEQCCKCISHLRIITIMLIQAIEKWRFQLVSLQNYVEFEKRLTQKKYPIIFYYQNKNILQTINMDTLFLNTTMLRRYITFSKSSDPLFLFPLKELKQNEFSNQMKKYNSVWKLFDISYKMKFRLENCQRILKNQITSTIHTKRLSIRHHSLNADLQLTQIRHSKQIRRKKNKYENEMQLTKTNYQSSKESSERTAKLKTEVINNNDNNNKIEELNQSLLLPKSNFNHQSQLMIMNSYLSLIKNRNYNIQYQQNQYPNKLQKKNITTKYLLKKETIDQKQQDSIQIALKPPKFVEQIIQTDELQQPHTKNIKKDLYQQIMKQILKSKNQQQLRESFYSLTKNNKNITEYSEPVQLLGKKLKPLVEKKNIQRRKLKTQMRNRSCNENIEKDNREIKQDVLLDKNKQQQIGYKQVIIKQRLQIHEQSYKLLNKGNQQYTIQKMRTERQPKIKNEQQIFITQNKLNTFPHKLSLNHQIKSSIAQSSKKLIQKNYLESTQTLSIQKPFPKQDNSLRHRNQQKTISNKALDNIKIIDLSNQISSNLLINKQQKLVKQSIIQHGQHKNLQDQSVDYNKIPKIGQVQNSKAINTNIQAINNQKKESIQKKKNVYKVTSFNIPIKKFNKFLIDYKQVFTPNQLNYVNSYILSKTYHHFYFHEIKQNNQICAIAISAIKIQNNLRNAYIYLFKFTQKQTSIQSQEKLIKCYTHYLLMHDPCHHLYIIGNNPQMEKLYLKSNFIEVTPTNISTILNLKIFQTLRKKQLKTEIQQLNTFQMKHSIILIPKQEKKIFYSIEIQPFCNQNCYTQFLISKLLNYFLHSHNHQQKLLQSYITAQFKTDVQIPCLNFENISKLNHYLHLNSYQIYQTVFNILDTYLGVINLSNSFNFDYLVNETSMIFQVDNQHTFYAQNQNLSYVMLKLQGYKQWYLILIKQLTEKSNEPIINRFKKSFSFLRDFKMHTSNHVIQIPFFRKELYGRIMTLQKKWDIFGHLELSMYWKDYVSGFKIFNQQKVINYKSNFLLGIVQFRQQNLDPIIITQVNNNDLI